MLCSLSACYGHALHFELQTGEAPVILPSPPKRKRKKPARPGDEDDDSAANLAAPKKRKASGDGAKPRKARCFTLLGSGH